MWTTKAEELFFLSKLESHFKMLEWGSGESSRQIAEKVFSLISIENNPDWFIKVAGNLPNNAIVKFCRENLPWISVDGNDSEFKSYTEISKYFGPYDCVFVDGRNRVGCVKFLLKNNLLKENGLIFFHDFGKINDEVLNYVELIELVDTMAMFKAKS